MEVIGTSSYHFSQQLPHLVAYTTHTSHLNDASRAGFHSFLSKPIDGRQFADQLARILEGEPVWEVSG